MFRKLLTSLPFGAAQKEPTVDEPPKEIPVRPKDYDKLFKIVLTGDYQTGKSQILNRFADENEFSTEYVATIGVDFRLKTLNVQGERIKLQIWDTAGQQRYQPISGAYYRGSSGLLIVFDVTSQNSFEHLPHVVQEVKDQHGPIGKAVLVGNKKDLESERVIDSNTAQEFAENHSIPYVEVSAKDGTGIEDAFLELIRLMNGGQYQQDTLIKFAGNDR